MPETVAGYTLLEQIGAGGMGEVWRVRRGPDGPQIALKLLKRADDSDLASRLLREGQILSRVRHPNLVRVHEVGVAEGRAYVAMELVDGNPLGDLIQLAWDRCTPFSYEHVEGIAGGVALGLAALHENGVLHRDLKPANVLVVGGMVPVLLDLGIALETDSARVTQEGMALGTVAYLSPEQALGEALDERSDVYQFGLLLYELLTLERPYADLEPLPALSRRLSSGVPPVTTRCPDVPAHLADLTAACLGAKQFRPASFTVVFERLTAPRVPVQTTAPAPAASASSGERWLGPYRLLEKLGQGGMGVVHRAVREGEAPVAVKELLQTSSDVGHRSARFQREIRMMMQINHPRVVRIVDHGVDSGYCWLAMELICGRTLREVLKERRELPPTEVRLYFGQIAEALAAIHRAGMVHRDLKPENVMMAQDGAHLMDLGLAHDPTATALTGTGRLVGTLPYLPPEYVLTGRYDPRGDVYQLGVLLHEMVAGSRPEDLGLPDEVSELDKLAPPELPDALAGDRCRDLALIHPRLLAPHPGRRLVDAEQVVAALAAGGAVSMKPLSARAKPTRATEPRTARKKPVENPGAGPRTVPTDRSTRMARMTPSPAAAPARPLAALQAATAVVGRVVYYLSLLIVIVGGLALLASLPQILHYLKQR